MRRACAPWLGATSRFALVFVMGCASRETFEGGIRLSFRITPADVEVEAGSLRADVLAIVSRRLELAEVRRFRVVELGEGEVGVEVPSSETRVADIVALLESPGQLELRIAGQESFATDSRSSLSSNSGLVVEEARVVLDGLGRASLAIEFSASTGRRLEELTSRNQGKRLEILFDGAVVAAPVIHSRIGRRVLLGAVFEPEGIRRVAILLSSGALPAFLVFLCRGPVEGAPCVGDKPRIDGADPR